MTIQISAIPQELKELRRWVVWRQETRNGKPTKVPYVAGTRGRADTTDPKLWGTFEAAFNHYRTGKVDGIGFVFTDTPYCGVDLDKCTNGTDRLEPWAKEIVNELDSYVEWSPSGRGVHIICKAALPEGRRRKDGIEMYDTDRFFTMTGDALWGRETISTRQDEMEALHARIFPQRKEKRTPQPMTPNNMDDADLVQKAMSGNGGAKFAKLWAGDFSDYASQSEADLALCNILVFWTRGDAERVDRLFRQSGLYRAKWERENYRQPTIQSAIEVVTEYYTPAGKNGQATNGTAAKSAPNGQTMKETTSAQEKKYPKTPDYVAALNGLGYQFRLNVCTDTVEVNGEPISDQTRAELRARMRDIGYRRVGVMEDAFTYHAGTRKYHPVRQYLDGLRWDGGDHIDTLASHFKDTKSFLPVFLRRWLIGAVARAYQKCQNRMLVLDGPQGVGKSYFCQWLTQSVGYENAFVESPICPDNKDHLIRLISHWVWEVKELGATTRKADRDALKSFLSLTVVTVRKPYGHYPIVKPALSSFIGTINDAAGFLDDPTGHRRFMCVTLEGIDWGYTKAVPVNQLWAQAKAAYDAGETWELKGLELEMAEEANTGFEVSDPLEDLIFRRFARTNDPNDFVPTFVILDKLHLDGWRLSHPRHESMEIAGLLKKLGIEPARRRIGNDRPNGYLGLREIGLTGRTGLT